MTDSVDYGSQLPEAIVCLAKVELREEKDIKKQSLDLMRSWIIKSPDIKYCRTDASFLLRFLRTRKYSVPQSQEMLERYLAIRQVYPAWFKGLNANEEKLAKLINAGYCFPLRERDEFGRKVIFTIMNKFNPVEYTAQDMVRTHALVVETLLEDEESQITGYTQIYDETGLGMQHLAIWSLADIKNIIKCIQNSLPMRHKSSHFVNLPPAANTIFEFFLSLLNDKLKQRINIHKSVEDLHKVVNKDILPKEYGGIVPMADMIADFKADLAKKNQLLQDLDKLEIDITRHQKLLDDFSDQLSGLPGSFKQLNVD